MLRIILSSKSKPLVSRVIVCGAINIDLLATAVQEPLRDDSTPGVLHRSAGGVGRNIAENLARLGIEVGLISSVGDDDFGRWIISHNDQAGIDNSGIAVKADLPTSSYTAVHGPDGEMLLAVSDMRLFDQFELPANLTLESSDLLVIDANLPESVIGQLVDGAHLKTIAADAVSCKKCNRLKAYLPQLSLLKVNRAEANTITGCSSDNDGDLINELLALGVQQVLLSTGEDGAILADSNQVVKVASDKDVTVVSTSGVGDAMFAGVLAARLYGYNAREQLRWGTAAAAATLGVQSACCTTVGRKMMQHK